MLTLYNPPPLRIEKILTHCLNNGRILTLITMRKKLFIYIIIVLLLLLIGGVLLAGQNALHPQKVEIWDGGNKHISNITYFSSVNGRWLNAKNDLTIQHKYGALLENNNPFESASYQIAIGNRIGKFYCTAEIKNPGFGGKPSFTHHQGHCQTFVTPKGQLALVVGKIS
jgi:hypothetical protein